MIRFLGWLALIYILVFWIGPILFAGVVVTLGVLL